MMWRDGPWVAQTDGPGDNLSAGFSRCFLKQYRMLSDLTEGNAPKLRTRVPEGYVRVHCLRLGIVFAEIKVELSL